MKQLMLRRFSMMGSMKKEYFHFEDPEAEVVVANFIGDGIGTTLSQIKACTSIGTLFDDNTNVLTFDEFEEFTGITSDVSNGFRNTSITSVKCPQGVNVNIVAFQGNTTIKDLHVKGKCNVRALSSYNTFANSGTLIVDGIATFSGGSSYRQGLFLNYVFKKSFYVSDNQSIFIRNGTSGKTIRVGNSLYIGSTSGSAKTTLLISYTTGTCALKFLEVMNQVLFNNSLNYMISGTVSRAIAHLGRNDLACTETSKFSVTKFDKVYVGDGSSKQSDENVLALYLADSGWSSYSSKLATWWDYNGEYKWYYVTDALTNCTNTNPDEWPHITRGESYRTTIVPDEGMALDSVTVEMYEAVDDGTTPSTPTDITSSVYDSSTGEIKIPAVTGNVIITASAS